MYKKQTDVVLLVFMCGEISLWGTGQDHFHYGVRNTTGCSHSNSKALGKCMRPTCVDDILKSCGSTESCPSYSKANMWRLHAGCLIAQSCPSWQGKSPREVYLIWCLRRNKQTNETLLNNTFIIIPTKLYSLGGDSVCNQNGNKKGAKETSSQFWLEPPQSPDCL